MPPLKPVEPRSIRPRCNVLPVVQSADDVADAIKVTGLLDGVGTLPKIPRNLFEPIVGFDEPLSHEGLNHRIAQDGPVRFPVGHFIANHLVTKLAQRFEAFGFRKRRIFLQPRIRRRLRRLFLAPYFRSRRRVRRRFVNNGRLASRLRASVTIVYSDRSTAGLRRNSSSFSSSRVV